MTAVIWFRLDLRIEDNPAFAAACNENTCVIPLFIHGSKLALGAAQNWWLHYSLTELQRLLKAKGLELCLKKGDPLSILKFLIKQQKIYTLKSS